MKSIAVLASLFGAINAFPQQLDFDAIADADSIPSVSIPIGPIATTVIYDAEAAYQAVTQAVNEDLPTQTVDSAVDATDSTKLRKRGPCDPLPRGPGPVPSPDTPEAFLAYSVFASAASAAPTPSGYVNTFTNLQASNNAYGYLGFSTLSTYDSNLCASRCNSVKGCVAFNLYFERDPNQSAGDACLNPASNTVIKCVYFGGPVNKQNAVNVGQYRNKFRVVIAGSNGYVNYGKYNLAGYNTPTYLNNMAIGAPVDCAGDDTSMGGARIFTDGPFDPGLCAAACGATSAYNLANPPASGSPQTCQFFNTYLLLKNGNYVGQYCNLYSEAWDASKATYSGQTVGSNQYTVAFSYSFVNSTNPGAPRIPCAVASATSAIVSATLQPYCSSLLGYTTPASVSTITVPSVVPSATTTQTNFLTTVTAVTTTTQLVAVTQVRKRDAPKAITSCGHDHTVVARQVADVTTTLSALPLTTAWVSGFADVAFVPQSISTGDTTPYASVAKRDTRPAALSAFAENIISSACSLKAAAVTITSTISTTVTSTTTSGVLTTVITSAVTTATSTSTVTSTTTIKVAAGAPTGVIGYLKVVPRVNANADYALSDAAGHLTDNYNYPNQRETFILDKDGYLYSVTNNAWYSSDQGSSDYGYYYASDLLYWGYGKSYGQPNFEASPAAADGGFKIRRKVNGSYKPFCLMTSASYNGGTTGMHVYTHDDGITIKSCVPIELFIYPI